MSLHFILGKSFDDLRNYDAAMRHYDAANLIRHVLEPFDRNALARHIDEAIAQHPPHAFAEGGAGGSDDETPVLVLGMPRSGTTLVEQILSSHARVGGGGELTFWDQRMTALRSAGNASRTKRPPGARRRLCSRCCAALGRRRRGSPTRCRSTSCWIGLIHLVFPRARIIHCRRNPIDTCLSIYFTYFQSPMRFVSRSRRPGRSSTGSTSG